MANPAPPKFISPLAACQRLADAESASSRLILADRLLAANIAPRELIKACGLDPAPLDLLKAGYDPDQPRVYALRFALFIVSMAYLLHTRDLMDTSATNGRGDVVAAETDFFARRSIALKQSSA
jgi:hypothetical protein